MTQRRTSIARVTARQVLDSRGRPTTEADVVLADGSLGRACAPSGASRGRHEAWELRDGGAMYEGLGVLNAVGHVKGEIAGAIAGFDAMNQRELDATMVTLDGTATLGRLGANAILAVSLACARAAALSSGVSLYAHFSRLAGTAMSLPMPMANILSGGAHAGRGMDIQDFLCMPIGASSYSHALEMISRVRGAAAEIMNDRGLSILLADEGGLSPRFRSAEQALELMMDSIAAAGMRAGKDMAIALDVAASELYEHGGYSLKGEGRSLSGEEMIEFVVGLVRRFPIVSVEDGLDQDDWAHWRALSDRLSDIQIVGDDLFATNVGRIKQGSDQKIANAALIKLNQNGTLSGTLDAIAAARAAGFATIVSARSGETEDSIIADFAVGIGAGQIKIGSVRNSERLAKYNQLLRIEEEAALPFAGVTGVRWRPELVAA